MTGRGKLSGLLEVGPVAIHSSGQTIFSLAHIEGISLGTGEEVDEVAGGASGMDRIGKVGDQSSEGQAARVYGAGFTAGSPAGKGAKDGMSVIKLLSTPLKYIQYKPT